MNDNEYITIEFKLQGEYQGVITMLNKEEYYNKDDNTLRITFENDSISKNLIFNLQQTLRLKEI